MLRRAFILILAAGLASQGCATTDPTPEHPQPAPSEGASTKPVSGKRCAATDDLVALRMQSQGSHALAVTDLTLDFGSGRLTGATFRLPEAGDPVKVPVDREVGEDAREALRAYLRTVCGPIVVAEGPRSAAPGGSTTYEITDADGPGFVLVYGQANVPAGERYLEITREQFITLGQLFPDPDPSSR
jgi:hypothetical protein